MCAVFTHFLGSQYRKGGGLWSVWVPPGGAPIIAGAEIDWDFTGLHPAAPGYAAEFDGTGWVSLGAQFPTWPYWGGLRGLNEAGQILAGAADVIWTGNALALADSGYSFPAGRTSVAVPGTSDAWVGGRKPHVVGGHHVLRRFHGGVWAAYDTGVAVGDWEYTLGLDSTGIDDGGTEHTWYAGTDIDASRWRAGRLRDGHGEIFGTATMQNGQLYGVYMPPQDVSADLVFVCGQRFADPIENPVLLFYGGVGWSVNDAPIPDDALYGASFYGVHGTGLTDVWCAGYYWKDFGGGQAYAEPLVAHWDGSGWTTYKPTAPTPHDESDHPGEVSGYFRAVWAVAPDDVWFVGQTQFEAEPSRLGGGPTGEAMIFHWDGASMTDYSDMPGPPFWSPGHGFFGWVEEL